MAFTSCILFTSETSEQNTTSKGHLALKKATISREYDVHSLFLFHPLTSISINVRTRMSLLFQGFVKSIWPFEFDPMHEGHIRPRPCFRTRYVHSKFFPFMSISIDVRTFMSLIFQVFMKSWPSMAFLSFMYLCSTFYCTY